MLTRPPTNARLAFAPTAAEPAAERRTPWSARIAATRALRELRPRTFFRLLVDFYRDPLSWLALVISALILAYGGGAVMFGLHAVYLGEGGPAISPGAHWALDSTAGFLGLTPAIALIIPITAWMAIVEDRVSAAGYALVGGTLFALATAPGPVLHDALIGRGTWLANQVTHLIGSAGAPRPGIEISHVTSIAWQVAVGLPTYTLLTAASLWLVRLAVRSGARPKW